MALAFVRQQTRLEPKRKRWPFSKAFLPVPPWAFVLPGGCAQPRCPAELQHDSPLRSGGTGGEGGPLQQAQAGAARPEGWAAPWAPCTPALLPPGQVAAGAWHPHAAGRGAASGCLGDAAENRAVGRPFDPHVLVTGHDATQPISAGRDLFSHQVATSCGTSGSSRRARERGAKTCLQQLLRAGRCCRSRTALFVLAWG